MLMADMGAEVIKIENPESPDYVRVYPPFLHGESLNYLSLNRSKRSMALNYSTEEGRETFLQLVETADIVVEQFRPGYLDTLGIGYAAAKVRNPGIIYVSITGYGQTGPYASLAGHDLNYLALSGVLGMTGAPGEAPTPPGMQLADIAGGSYMAVVATLSAVYARQQSGLGQHVDVAMTDAVMPLLSLAYAQFIGGQPPMRGEMPLSGGLPNYGIYPCADGKYIALGTLEPKFWGKFCTLINHSEWIHFMLPENSSQLPDFKAKITNLFRTKPQSEWVKFGHDHDLLITAVLDPAEIQNDPHLRARNMIEEQDHPRAGRYSMIGVPLKFSLTKAQSAWPAPVFGEDTAAIFRELEELKKQATGYTKKSGSRSSSPSD
jgi:crotonobetainyl-CoA:carnitine CoA-transferase CaiB-like acyl-CoA transferase